MAFNHVSMLLIQCRWSPLYHKGVSGQQLDIPNAYATTLQPVAYHHLVPSALPSCLHNAHSLKVIGVVLYRV